ncbi:MAG: TRAP transporter small permease [Rhodobacteraceae bacterium]|nr:TRAP transporter small permease [Paracoccaceae bacterium]
MELYEIVNLYGRVLTRILAICRFFAIIAISAMVVCILIQVFCRYVLNNALPWPEEAARFFMLWMTGLVAPSAFRWGGFVSIDLIKDALGNFLGSVLNLLILILSLAILIVTLSFAIRHINSGWLFDSSSLRIPLSLIGLETIKLKLAWVYMSLPLGFLLMFFVGIELIIQQVHTLINPRVVYHDPEDKIESAAE